jgi:hypothetical protein
MIRCITRLILGLLLVGPVGCGDTQPSTSGTLSVALTDAAGDFRAAVVTITGIYLQGDASDADASRVWLSRQTVTTDLITLANDTATLVDRATVPAGRYAGLRFIVSGGYVEVEGSDGATHIYATAVDYGGLPVGATVDGDLQMPSFATSGLKVALPDGMLAIEGGDEKILLVDFDVSQSFGHEAGGSGKWVMHPVVRGTDIVVSGSIAVAVKMGPDGQLPLVGDTPATLADVRVRLTDKDGGVETLALVDGDGDDLFVAAFRFLDPRQGPFMLDLVLDGAAAITTSPVTPATLVVDEGATVNVVFDVTGGTAAGP